MESRKIYFDKTEIVLIVLTKKKVLSYNLVSSDIKSIRFEKCKEYRFKFVPFDSERILITSSKLPSGASYTRGRNKKYFDEYKKELREYAKKYYISLVDTTDSAG